MVRPRKNFVNVHASRVKGVNWIAPKALKKRSYRLIDASGPPEDSLL